MHGKPQHIDNWSVPGRRPERFRALSGNETGNWSDDPGRFDGISRTTLKIRRQAVLTCASAVDHGRDAWNAHHGIGHVDLGMVFEEHAVVWAVRQGQIEDQHEIPGNVAYMPQRGIGCHGLRY